MENLKHKVKRKIQKIAIKYLKLFSLDQQFEHGDFENEGLSICKNLISLFSNLNENIVLILDEIPINEEEIIMFKNNKKINLFFTSQMPIDSFKKVNNLIDIFLFRGDNHLNLDFLEVL